MINEVLAEVWLTVGPEHPQTYPVVILQVPEFVIGIDIFRN